MNFIKNIFKTLAVTAVFSANVLAGDFLVDTTIDDTLGDAHGPTNNEWKYEVAKMDVKWASDDQITVDIYTNFVDYNNKYSTGSGNGKIVFGDLLIGTDGANSPFDYAFVLSEAGRKEDEYYNKKHWDNTGTFTEISSTVTSKEYHNNSSSVLNGQIMAGTTIGTGQQSDWTVDRQNASRGYDKISFSFNVNGIDAFQNASQLAFSWAMSCANDVVEGVVDVNRPTNVPEPATFLLMLFALAFMAKTRSKKTNNLST